MLRNIPDIISPELMETIMEMGHGDEICFADANFPVSSYAQRMIRADGHKISDLLDAIMQFFPLDVFVEQPVIIMDAPAGDEPKVWTKYEEVIKKNDFAKAFNGFEKLERFHFYDRTMDCFAIVATGETEGYANIILKKGVIFK